MTKQDLLLIVTLLGCVALAGQEPNTIHVPLTDPSQPANLKVTMVSGSTTVRGYDGKEVVIETSSEVRPPAKVAPENSTGLRRIDLGGGLRIEEQDNNVQVSASPDATTAVVIRVPQTASVHLRLVNGGITVEDVEGEIDANTANGTLTLQNISGSVIGHSLNGKIVATFERVASGKPMSFTSLNGDIDVTLPANVQARFKMKTNAEIYTDFELKFEGNQTEQLARSADGRYRIPVDGTVYGTVNGGGPDYQFTSMNGAILIRKK